jgi:c-di-GMP-binding flagellar brake protein YcgR
MANIQRSGHGENQGNIMRRKTEWGRNSKDSDEPDGRKHPRTTLNLPVEYYATNPKTPRVGHTSDLSPDGVLLNIPEKLDIGQSIKLAIFVYLDKTVETIKVNSQVVWVAGREKDGSFLSGVKFIDLSSNDRHKLEKFFEDY